MNSINVEFLNEGIYVLIIKSYEYVSKTKFNKY